MIFRTPVRPGDTVGYELVVTSKRLSKSLPGWGLLHNTVTGRNQRGELVYEAEVVSMSKLRDYKMPIGLRVLQAVSALPVLRRLMAR
jgi:acyl dehydratase